MDINGKTAAVTGGASGLGMQDGPLVSEHSRRLQSYSSCGWPDPGVPIRPRVQSALSTRTGSAPTARSAGSALAARAMRVIDPAAPR